jgi:uncharacterized protein YjlB
VFAAIALIQLVVCASDNLPAFVYRSANNFDSAAHKFEWVTVDNSVDNVAIEMNAVHDYHFHTHHYHSNTHARNARQHSH